MKTINELDAVALTCDLPEFGLKAGDVGTAVLVHGSGVAFEVESSATMATPSHSPLWRAPKSARSKTPIFPTLGNFRTCHNPPIRPGEALREKTLTPMGIPQNAMTRAVTPIMSIRFGAFFGQSEGFWHGLQVECDFRALSIAEDDADLRPLSL